MSNSFRSADIEQLEQSVRSACSELGRGLRAGEPCSAEQFLARLPGIADHSDLALEVLYTEYVVREELGQPVSQGEWLARFPEWADDLRQLFEVHQQVCGSDTLKSFDSQLRPLTKASADGSRPSAASPTEENRLVGNYQLLEELGRGGMGVVYRARQLTLNREVALKMILSGEFASPHELGRFQREAESAARLQHPNIIQIYEVGAHERRPFLSMELVRGDNLETRLRKSPPAPRQAAMLLEKIARAVDFAHQQGIVHRDLKPSNVLMTPEGEPKVADFGLAKQVLVGHDGYTHSGAIVGTPSYMAPELAGGNSAAVGPPTDVYSLGVILYEMLVGRPPLVAATPLETLRRLASEEPVPPTRLSTSIPRDLETICLKCLQKETHRRFATAGELADDLRRFLQGEPILAKSVGPVERMIKWTRRRPALAMFIASLIISLAAVSTLWRTAENRRREAQTAAEQAERSRAFAQREQIRSERSLYFRRIGQAKGELQANMIGRANELLDQCPPEMRNLEWSYLRLMCGADLRTMRGHTDVVWSLAYSPDGKLIASGSGQWGFARPGEIIVWDAATGRQVSVIRGHNGPIMSLDFSPDGQKLASSSVEWEHAGPPGVKIWSVSGEQLLSLPAPGTESHAIRFSPDGTTLAVGGTDSIQLWDAQRGVLLRQFTGHKGIVLGVAFHPNGKRLASVGRDGSARVYEVETGKEEQVFSGFVDLRRIAFSPDGRYLAFTNYGGNLHLWDLADPPDKLDKHSFQIEIITAFAFSPDGRRIGLSSSNGSVLIVDAISGQELKRLYTHDGTVRELKFNEDGRLLVTAGLDGLVKLWDARTNWDDTEISMAPLARCGSFNHFAITPDGNRLVLPNGFNHSWHGAGEMTLLVYDLQQHKLIHKLYGHTGWLTDVAVTPDGARYASSSVDKTVRVWNAASGAQEQTLEGHTGGVMSVACDPAGQHLASADTDGVALVWDLATGKPLRKLQGHDGQINRIAFSIDGKQLATAGRDRTVRIWDFASGKQVQLLHGHAAPVTSLAYSHHGKLLASSSEDGSARVWNAATGALIYTLRGHSKTVIDVAFSMDDQRLGTCSTDWTVKLWDIESGEEALALRDSGTSLCMAFHPDGKRIMCAHAWYVHIWDTQRRESPKLDAEFERANVAWHQRQGRSCRASNLPEAARFHYARLAQYPAASKEEYLRRATAHAELGDWKRAADDFAAALQRGASGMTVYAGYALTQLELGNTQEYRNGCRRLIDAINDSTTPRGINDAVWFAVIAPEPRADISQLVALLRGAIEKATEAQRFGMDNTLGAALYRYGRLEEARQAVQQSIASSDGRFVEDWLVMAMVEARLGNHDQARPWLDKFDAWMAGAPDTGAQETPHLAAWDVRLCRTMLAREARQVVADGPEDSGQSSEIRGQRSED